MKKPTKTRQKRRFSSLCQASLAAVSGGGDSRSGSRGGDDDTGPIIIIGRDGP